MKRTALALALAAASFAAAPAHASTTVTIHLQLDAVSTCTAGTGPTCDVTLTPVYCSERFDGTMCSAEPVTLRTFGVRVGDACVLELGVFGDLMVVHTQALGDLTLQPVALAVASGTITFAAEGTYAPAATVLAGTGLIFGPNLGCDFDLARIEAVLTAVGL